MNQKFSDKKGCDGIVTAFCLWCYVRQLFAQRPELDTALYEFNVIVAGVVQD